MHSPRVRVFLRGVRVGRACARVKRGVACFWVRITRILGNLEGHPMAEEDGKGPNASSRVKRAASGLADAADAAGKAVARGGRKAGAAGKVAGDVAGYVGEVGVEAAGLGAHVAARSGRKALDAGGKAAGAAGKGAVVGGKKAGKGAKQVADVLVGADIRAFDDFTDAAMRVIIGLHEDNERLKTDTAELKERVAKVEAVIAELKGC